MILPAGARHILIRFRGNANVTLSLKERQTNQVAYQGKLWSNPTNRTTFVTEGSKFTRQNLNNTDLLHARGPLLGPLVVLTKSDQIGETFSANISFGP